MSDLPNILQRLEQLLKNDSPNLYYSFNEGVSDQEIAGVEQKVQEKLPDELKKFFSWHNGMKYDSKIEFLSHIIYPLKGLSLYPVKLLSRRAVGNDFKKEAHKWLELLHDGNDNIHYDLNGTMFSKGSLFYLPHDDVIVTQLAPNLKTYLAGVVDCMEDGRAFFLDDGSLCLLDADLQDALTKYGFQPHQRELPFRRK